METKKLFVLTQDGGDGSYCTRYTLNEEWIKERERLSNDNEICYPELGCDGDGFHYGILNVPVECTLESLGIHYDCAR